MAKPGRGWLTADQMAEAFGVERSTFLTSYAPKYAIAPGASQKIGKARYFRGKMILEAWRDATSAAAPRADLTGVDDGPVTPSIEEARLKVLEEQYQKLSDERMERRGQLVRVQKIREALQEPAAIIRSRLDQLQRRCGAEGYEIGQELLADLARAMERALPPATIDEPEDG